MKKLDHWLIIFGVSANTLCCGKRNEFLLWVQLTSCCMFDIKSFSCPDEAAVVDSA